MISLFGWALLVICTVVVLLFYYILTYQKPETPIEVYIRLLRVLPQTPVAFTYSKLGSKYENFMVNDEGGLDRTLDDAPINYDGTFFQEPSIRHGNLVENSTGFTITGIDIPFSCPLPWIYENGKCVIPKICPDGETNTFRGIDYYYFSENLNPSFTNIAFHPRLYYKCNAPTEPTVEACAPNELYTGGAVVSADAGLPCTFYDVCADRTNRTTHQFQIDDRVLAENEFYVCENGVSVLRQCPPLTGFSRIANACIQINRCLNLETGTFEIDENRFALCRNGQEVAINCPRGVFPLPDQQFQCRNPACEVETTHMRTVPPYFRYPDGFVSCQPGENNPIATICDGPLESVYIGDTQQTNMPYQSTTNLFDPYLKPTVIYQDDACVPFDYNIHSQFVFNQIIDTQFNCGLPPFNYNVISQTMDFSRNGPDIYYKDGPNIKNSDGSIVDTDSTRYANFQGSENYSRYRLRPSVDVRHGDVDYVLYMISFDMTSVTNDRSPIWVHCQFPMNCLPDLFWNAYRGTFTSFTDAHMMRPVVELQFAASYIYQYTIVDIVGSDATMLVWTRLGGVELRVTINENAYFDDDNLISHKTLPKTSDILRDFVPAHPLVGVLTSVRHTNFEYHHVPICLQWVDSFTILGPLDAINMGPEILFRVDHGMYFENYTGLE